MSTRATHILLLLGLVFCLFVSVAHAQTQSYFKIIPINNLQVQPLMDGLQGPMHDFVPAGIEVMLGLPTQSAILVRASDQASLDQLTALIKAIDQPIKQVRVELTLVDMGSAAAGALAGQVQFAQTPISIAAGAGPGAATSQLRYGQGSLSAGLGAMTTAHTGTVMSAPSILVPSGGTGTFALGGYNLPLQGLSVDQLTVAPDNSVTMHVVPFFAPGQMAADLPSVRVGDGESMVVAGFRSSSTTSNAGTAGATAAAGGRDMMLILTPHVIVPDTTDFGALQMPQPLW